MAGIENVAALFTDLVGSTELGARLSPDAADELRQAHFSVLRRAIAASAGIEVKSLGDGLMVVFATASAALSCAVAMQQEVDRDNRTAERDLGLRIGLSVGEATRDNDDYFGAPVVEAARLCARAEAGKILATELVRAMAGRRSQQGFSSLGQFELKGLPEPVEVLEVIWEPLTEAELAPPVIPLPTRLALRPGVGVIGRGPETALLADAFKRVLTGEGREVVLISGEAGLGKTTLAAEAARQAFENGAGVLLGRCDEDLGAPYQPFAEALAHYVVHGPDEVLRSHVHHRGADLERMVPALGQRLGELPTPLSSDPETERYMLLGAAVNLLAQASMTQPILLVLDDLQWADKPSLQLLRHLVTSADAMHLLVVAIYRDSELSRGHPLNETLAAMRREHGVSRIELTGLDHTDVIAFMEAAAGHDLDDTGFDLARALHRETDGNPFFVGEVLRHLAETGAVLQDAAGRWTTADLAEVALPDSVREVITARVGRLGEPAGEVLALASVIGRDFDLELLDRVTGCGEEKLIDILDDASSAALVRELTDVPGHYSFSHALIQHTLYQDLGATRLARAHRRVAEALEALVGGRPGDRVGELAHHFITGAHAVDVDKAIDYARQAGDAALEALAPDDAMRYYTETLKLLAQRQDADPLLHVDVLLGLGNAQRQAGVPAFRETLLDAAHRSRELADHDRLVAAALANHRGFASATGLVDDERRAVLEAALGAVSQGESRERALLLALLASELTYADDGAQRFEIAQRAIQTARKLDDPMTLQRVLNITYHTLWVAGEVEQRLRSTAEAGALAERANDPAATFWAHYWRGFAVFEAGDMAETERSLELASDIAAKIRQPMLQWVSSFARSWRSLLRGDVQSAEDLASQALQIGTESGQPDATAVFGALLLSIRWYQGRLDEVSDMVATVADDNPGIPGFRAAQGLCLVESGRIDQARDLLGAALERSFTHDNNLLWLTTMVLWAEVAGHLKHREAASALADLLRPFGNRVCFNGVNVYGAVDHYLGHLTVVTGDLTAAELHFSRALSINQRLRSPFFVSRTKLELSRMLLSRRAPDDEGQARTMLAESLDAARRSGCSLVERRAHKLLEEAS